MSFDIYKITDLEFVWESLSSVVLTRALSPKADILLCWCKGISDGPKVKETSFVSLTSKFWLKKFSQRSQKISAKK